MYRQAVNYDPDELEAEDAPAKNKGGRPPLVVTDMMRRTVRAMAGFGIKHSDVCKVIGCDKATLYRHFREELDKAIVEANSMVAQSLFKRATEGTGKEAVTAQIFWLKCNAGWKEAYRVEHTGKDGAPIETVHKLVRDPIEAARAYQRLMEDDSNVIDVNADPVSV